MSKVFRCESTWMTEYQHTEGELDNATLYALVYSNTIMNDKYFKCKK